jgi:hypothetical protein
MNNAADSATNGARYRRNDAVGQALEVVGWITFGLALVVALLVFIASVGSADTTGTGTGTVIAIVAVGGLQSLLLVGFGRLIQHTKASADFQHQTNVLLQRAIDNP